MGWLRSEQGHRYERRDRTLLVAPGLTRNEKLLGTSASLLVTSALLVVTRTLLGAPGLTTRNKKLLVTRCQSVLETALRRVTLYAACSGGSNRIAQSVDNKENDPCKVEGDPPCY